MTQKELLADSVLLASDVRCAGVMPRTAARRGLLSRLERLTVVRRLAALYSFLLEETVTPRRALRLLHAQTAILMFIFPVSMSLGLRALLLLWVALACRSCRRNS